MYKKDRTKAQIQNALLELLNEKSIMKITVGEVCERAFIARSTFYTHYDSINEAIRNLEDNLLSHMLELLLYVSLKEELGISEDRNKLDTYFPYVYENKEAIKNLFSEDGDPYFRLKAHKMLESVCKKITENISGPEWIKEIFIHSLTMGAIEHFCKWLEFGDGNIDELSKTVCEYQKFILALASNKGSA